MDTREFGIDAYANDEPDDPNPGVMIDMGASGKALTPEQARALAQRLIGIAEYLDPQQPEFVIAFELSEDYQGELDAFLADPASWPYAKPFDWLDYVTWHLFCPHCGSEDTISEHDTNVRWNSLAGYENGFELVADQGGGQLTTVARLGNSGDYEGDGFICESCLGISHAPDYFTITDWS